MTLNMKFQEYEELGEARGLVYMIQSFMSSLGKTLEETCSLANISVEDYQKALALLDQEKMAK